MRTLVNGLLFILVFVLTLISADFLLQWYLKIPGQEIKQICTFEQGQKPSKRLRKNLKVDLSGAFNEYRYHVTTNQDGFRQTGMTTQKNHDLIFLGDSQTFGVGVNDDQTFAAITGQLLETSVLNTACPGYNNIEELQIAKQVLKSERPKHLVLGFFAGNDPFENYANREKRESAPEFQQDQNSKAHFDLKAFLVKKSAIYNLVTRLRHYEMINQLLFRLKLVNDVPPPELIAFREGSDDQKEIFFDMTKSILMEINQAALASGTHLTIALIPDRYQVEDDYWHQWVKKYRLDENEYDRLAPNEQIRSFAQEKQIDFLDLTPPLKNESIKGNRVYWAIDSHLNPYGHQTIADSIARHLKQLDVNDFINR